MKYSVKGFTPMTRRTEVRKKKREFRDRTLEQVHDIAEVRKSSRGKPLAVTLHFSLYSGSGEEGRVKKDLDNLMKIVLDTLPDYMDRGHLEKGLGLIEGDSDHLIFEVNAVKELVPNQKEEGIDVEIFEWTHR